MISSRKSNSTLVVILSLLFWITACGGQQAKPEAQPEAKPAAQIPDPPLASKFQNIIVRDVAASPEIEKDYSDELKDCRNNLISELENQKVFESVALAGSGKKYPSRSLLVQARVSDIHIVHGAARFWAGAFAGSSYMNLDLKLTDAATGKVVREKEISSANNAWAAAWVGGSSDRTLPADMGRMVAGYIVSIMPK